MGADAAAGRVAAALLPVSTFLATWPVVSNGGTVAMIYWSMAYGRRTGRWADLLESEQAARLDEPGRRALARAHQEARRYNHGYVGTEHLLLAIVGDQGCAGARILGELGVTPAAVRAALEPSMPPGGIAPAREVAYAPRVRLALDRAASAAASASRVGTEHLLFGLAAVEDGQSVRGLVRAGVDLVRLRERIVGSGGVPGDSPP